MNDIYINDIYKTVVFEDLTTAHGTLVLLMDIASEAFAATVWDYMILINDFDYLEIFLVTSAIFFAHGAS